VIYPEEEYDSDARLEARPIEVPPGENERLLRLRRIVNDRQAEEIDGVLVDMQTANAIVSVYDALGDSRNREKFLSMSMQHMGVTAWKLIKLTSSKRIRG